VIQEQFVGLSHLESPGFLLFYVDKQHRKQHQTKNLPKPAMNCTQISHETQKQPHAELIEVHFHIHNFILAF